MGESAYEAFKEFKENLLTFHLHANPSNSSRLLVARSPISDDAFRRYLDIALYHAFTKQGNKISRPTAAHREFLQRMNGPVFSENNFNELHECLLGTISYLREKLDLSDEPDLSKTFQPADEPSDSQVVISCIYLPKR